MVEPASDAPGAPMRVRKSVPLDAAKVAACAAGPDGRRGTKDDWEKCRGAQRRRRRRGRLGAGQRARDRARRRRHDGVARRGRQRRRARAFRISSRPCARAGTHATPKLVRVRARRARSASHARDRRSHPERPVVLASRGHRAARVRAGVRREDLPRHRLDRGQDRHADVPQRRRHARRARAPVRCRCARARAASPRPAARCVRTSGTWPRIAPIPSKPRWTKAIAVLTERNWLADSGRIHGAGDHGPNPAAEIAHADRRAPRGKTRGARQ